MSDKPGSEGLIGDIAIAQIMSRGIICVEPSACLLDVVRVMRERRHSCTVVSSNDIPLGIVTERDVVRYLAETGESARPGSLTVGEVMSGPPVTVRETDSLYNAMVVIRAHHIRHLPVVMDDGRLVGLVTQSDITKAYFRLFENLSALIDRSASQRTKDLEAANERLKSMAMEDGLLGIGNRRAMEVDLDHTHAAAVRYKRPYTVVLFDLDCFKLYNDHYGHLAGDAALKDVATTLNRSIRRSDRLYRYGGEELLLLCPETPVEGSLTLADRLLEKVRALALPHCRNNFQIITLSGGIADVAERDRWADVVDDADHALYKAKKLGRNRVVVAEKTAETG